MRKDMLKIVTEPGKRGGYKNHGNRKNRHEARRDPENAISVRGMKKLHAMTNQRKESFPNYKPVYRYLEKQAGKPWNKVYSDLVHAIGRNTEQGRDLIAWVINRKVKTDVKFFDSNKVPQTWNRYYKAWRYLQQGQLYVHPTTGLLCKVEQNADDDTNCGYWARIDKLVKENSYTPPGTDGNTQYHKIDGIWYELRLRNASPEETKHGSFGKMASGLVFHSSNHLEHPGAFFHCESYWEERRIEPWIFNYLCTYVDLSESISRDVFRIAKYVFGVDGNCKLPTSKRQISKREKKTIEFFMKQRDQNDGRRGKR